jgi:hypothetical protein
MLSVDEMLALQIVIAQERSIPKAVEAQAMCWKLWESFMAAGQDADATCAMRWHGIFQGMAYAMACCVRK